MPKVIVNGLAVEYLDQGSGPVILMLHGWQDSLKTFDALVQNLHGYRIIRLDLPGFAGSEVGKTDWKLDDYAAFLSAFIQKLGIDVELVLGHSFGGRVLIKALSKKTINPPKLVLIASGGIAKTSSPRNLSYNLVAKIGKVLTIFLPESTRNNLRTRLYKSAGSDYLDAGNLKGVYVNAIRDDLSEDAKNIRIPTLLIWGDKDTETPVEDGYKFAQLISGSNLQILSADHFVHQTHPVHVAQLIKQFLG